MSTPCCRPLTTYSGPVFFGPIHWIATEDLAVSFAHVDPFTFASLDQPRLIETAAGTIHNASETRVGSIVDMSGEADFTVCDDTFCRSETGAPVSFHGLLVPTGVQASPTLATVYITGAVLYGTFTINN